MPEELKQILSWPQIAPGVFLLQQTGPAFRRTIRASLEIDRLYLEQPPNWRPLAFNLLENILLRGCTGTPAGNAADKLLFRAMEKLRDLSHPSDIDTIAKECGLARGVFYRKFREEIGLSPRHYRENHAMHYARQLLENTSLPVTEIARLAGMRNIYYFSNRFKKFAGVSPTACREQSNDQQK